MKVLVMGATGGSGRAAIEHLLGAGHEVTAFTRGPAGADAPGLRWVSGDASDARDVDAAVAGHDAVVVALGIRENPLRVRFLGPRATPIDIRSAGTRNVVLAMQRHGVRRLVVQTSYGVGATRERLGLVDGLFFELVLKPQIADTEAQEAIVTGSGLDWVLVQPVHLTDDADDAMPFVSGDGETRRMKVSRAAVGRVLDRAVTSREWVGASLAVSAA